MRIPDDVAERLYRQAQGSRWHLPAISFTGTLLASADRTFAGRAPSARDIEQYLSSLHLEDLALACACTAGLEAAWEHFIREHRPVLYRAADALDSGGGARELADALYADLYGIDDKDGERRSLFRYFSGRSSLATWLRAVLAQRHVDRLRAGRRLEPLPEDDAALPARTRPQAAPGADSGRLRALVLLERALGLAVAALAAKDRLRLSWYYADRLTLAEIGRLLGEHEATASRQLSRTRRTIREDVERYLEQDAGLNPDQVAECFESAVSDPGPIDLSRIMGRKDSDPDRSI